jgi:ribonuclease HI
MTNEVRWRRKITSNPCFSHCLTELETIIHALHDCPNALGVWDRIIEVADREAFYSLNWYTWLLNNLRFNHPSSKRKFWGIEFGIVLWQIWKERNHRIFSSSTSPYTSTVQVIRRLMGDVIHSMVGESGFKDNTKQRVCIGWRYPPIDWVKINVDGCSKGNPGLVGAGGVIRDAMGRWIVGFALNIGICTSVGAELWAITNGLKLAWSKGFRKIILESDSSLAVDLITKNKIFIDKNYNLIMQARELLAKEWDIQVRHVYREANSMADWLANYGLTRSFLDRFSIYFNDPPAGLYCILYYDLIGSTLPCLI